MASSLGGLGPRIAGQIFRSTGLTGLAVAKHPHHSLEILYGKILRACQQMPASVVYRQSTEKIATERLKLVKSIKDPLKLEEAIGAGMLEEVILQAENELILARNMVEWKPWEPLMTQAPEGQWQWPIKGTGRKVTQ